MNGGSYIYRRLIASTSIGTIGDSEKPRAVFAARIHERQGREFAVLLTSIKAQSPEAVFFGRYDRQAGPMARQTKSLEMVSTRHG